MDPELVKRKSKKLSWLLRHGAQEAGLEMDEAGWCDVEQVLRLLHMSRPVLEEVVLTNNKSRLEWVGQRLRASQGHSLEGMPVTQQALEASWALYEDDTPVWHGTGVDAARQILREGILPGARTHVHLADGLSSRTGKRAGVAVMLRISPQRMRASGHALYRSPNGVILTRYVPAASIDQIHPMTRKGEQAAELLRAALRG